jgi:hypothetical protein
VTPEFAAYQAQLRRLAWPLRAAGLALILIGASLLIASKGGDASLRFAGFALLALGWGLWGYVVFVRTRWARLNPYEGPR